MIHARTLNLTINNFGRPPGRPPRRPRPRVPWKALLLAVAALAGLLARLWR